MKHSTFRLENLLDAARKLEGMSSPGNLFSPLGIAGLNLFEVPVRLEPKLKLSDDVIVSDEFRAKTNAWLLEMFGERDVCPIRPGMAYIFGGNVIMRPESAALLRSVDA